MFKHVMMTPKNHYCGDNTVSHLEVRTMGSLPDAPVMSMALRFLALIIVIVSRPAVGK